MKLGILTFLFLTFLSAGLQNANAKIAYQFDDATFEKTFHSLYIALIRNNPVGFSEIWNNLSEEQKTEVAKYKDPRENAALLSYATYALPHYSENDPRKVSGKPVLELCKYAPENLDIVFYDVNTGTHETALTKALSNGMLELAQALIECGANVNLSPKTVLDSNAGAMFVPPLLFAAYLGDFKTFEMIANKTQLSNEVSDWKKRTALWWAYKGYDRSSQKIYKEVNNDHRKIIQVLQSSGVDKLTLYGCEIFNFVDNVPNVYSKDQTIADEKALVDMSKIGPEYTLTDSELAELSIENGRQACLAQGYQTCEVVNIEVIQSKKPEITSNPWFQELEIIKQVDLGSDYDSLIKYVGMKRKVANVIVAGFDNGTSAEQCRWLD